MMKFSLKKKKNKEILKSEYLAGIKKIYKVKMIKEDDDDDQEVVRNEGEKF